MVTPRTRAFFLVALLATAGLLACSDDTTSVGDVAELRVSAPTIVIDVGETVQLSVVGVTASGEDVPVSGVSWSSLDPQVASVDENGLVRGLAEGMARIEVRAGAVRDTFRISVGGRLVFNVNSGDACNEAELRDARIVAISERAIIAEDLTNPAGGFSDAEYETIAATFDTLIYPVVTQAFGEPGDVDLNDRVVILYTRAVNELTEPGSRSFVSGFFFSRDLFPIESRDGLEGCQTSNEAELFYMLAPDPTGELGNERTKDFVLDRTLGTIGHEFQHLINASRRLFETNATAFETIWLNEGLSHIAEELLFYEASGMAPRQHIDVADLRARAGAVTAFNLYAGGNFGRLAEYTANPTGESPYEQDDDLATRGATWSFLRYAADRVEGDDRAIWQALASSPRTGFDNLDAALGVPALRWVADWAAAHAADRYGLTASVPSTFALRSWDVSQILGELELAQLETETLSSGETLELDVVAGGSAYVRFRVAATGSPRVTTFRAGGSEPSCSGSARSLAVGEVVQGTLAELGALCFAPSLPGITQDYVLVATHLSTSSGATASLRVRGSELASPPTTRVAGVSGGPTLSRARALAGAGDVAAEFEHALRERELRELGWRMGGAGDAFRPEVNLQTSGAGSDVVLTLLRTR